MPRRLAAIALALTTAFAPLTALAQGQSPAEIAALKSAVFSGAVLPSIGNPNGKVTVVEFSDYNCGFCRKAAPEVAAFLKANPDVKLVIHEIPIFGEGSRVAARVALAANEQGRYGDFHNAMMKVRGKADQASSLRVARDLGLDMDRLQKDMDSPAITQRIETSLALADDIGLMGTPSFIAGDQARFGYLPRADLKEMADQARTP